MKDIIYNPKKIHGDIHLKNIFINGSYLELGIIDVFVVERLLNYELININDITYFPVQNKGLGHSNLHDERLKTYLPFIFFRRLVQNNQSLQLVITYGLLQYINNDKKEAFMPIILIPISMYYENNDLLVQMTQTPLINPTLYSVINSSKISFIQSLNLKDIYVLDFILSQIDKMNDFSVRLDNYLSYGKISENDIFLSYKSTFFNRVNNLKNDLLNHLYTKKESDVFTNIVLDKYQRDALYRLIDGESLAITGYNGCGKTTVLKSFIINNLARNKKTLYISNSSDSIKDLYNTFNDFSLSNFVVNLTESFERVVSTITNEAYYIPTGDINPLVKQLKGYYEFLIKFEKDCTQKLYDFTFPEMVENYCLVDFTKSDLIKSDLIDDKWINYDDINDIYKHEYDDIFNVLLSIEKGFEVINGFQDSIWKEIPIINNITHINQVIDVIRQLTIGLKELREQEIALKEFGVRNISSFSEMKKVIYPMDKMNISMIPKEWMTDIDVFKKAVLNYPKLKSDIYNYQQSLYYLQKKYNDAINIDINTYVESLFSKYYTIDNLDIIKDILINRKEISNMIDIIHFDLTDFFKATNELIEELNWDFLSKDENLFEMFDLYNLFENNYISKQMMILILNKKTSTSVTYLNELHDNINELNDEINIILKKHPKLAMLDYSKDVVYNDEYVRTYEVKIKKFKKLTKEYYEYIGCSYTNHNLNITSLLALKDYYDVIKQTPNRKIIVDFIQSMDEATYYNTLINFRIVLRSYDNIISSSLYFKKFIVEEKYNEFKNLSVENKIKVFSSYLDYITNLYHFNDLMDKLLQTPDYVNSLGYVDPIEYFTLKQSLEDFFNIIKSLDESKLYKECYGKLYKSKDTDVLEISKILQMYESYAEVYDSIPDLYNSFKYYESQRVVVDKIIDLTIDIGENLRLYSLIFKDSVSRYYFSNIENNIEYLTKLLDNEDELSIYLDITRGIGVLNNYHLFGLIKYIEENTNVKGIAWKFSKLYFKKIINEYLDKYDVLKKNKEYLNTLNKTIILEDVVCKQNGIKFINKTLKKTPIDQKIHHVDNYDYPNFFKVNTNRLKIYLTNKNFISNYYRYIDYDTVIVDDAHMIQSGDFNSIFKNKQVIICGDYQSNKVVNQNLIALATNQNTITFRIRYQVGPRQLTKNIPSVTSPHHAKYSDNFSVKVIEKDIQEYIYSLYSEDYNVKINFFIKDIDEQKQAYEIISSCFYKKNISVDDITYFLNNNINICDINARNYSSSQVNILYLKDYCYIDSKIVSSNIFEILMLAKQELVIFDNDYCLLKDINLDFFKRIKTLVTTNDVFTVDSITPLMAYIQRAFKEKGIGVYHSGNGVNMILKQKDKDELITLEILYTNGKTSEILNHYRDFYGQYVKNSHKVIIRTIIDLLNGIDEFVNGVIEEING